LYYSHGVSPGSDTLFSFLEAAHSMNDRLRVDHGLEFFDLPEFSAIKCLRNYFHHHSELRHAVTIVPANDYPIVTDLMVLCLVPTEIVESAIGETGERYREAVRRSCTAVFHQYGSVVNVNPALTNLVVAAYERMTAAGISFVGEAVEKFETSYLYEEMHGYSHRVDGRLATRAGDIDKLLADIMAIKGV
jgi:hypothetical protein